MTTSTDIEAPAYLQPPQSVLNAVADGNMTVVQVSKADLVPIVSGTLSSIERFKYFIFNLFDHVVDIIGVDNKWYQIVFQALAWITFGLLPLNIFTNIYFSYRLDPAKFFNRYSDYDYQKDYTGGVLFSFWCHKICTIIWTCFVIAHVLIITLYGTKVPKNSTILHRVCGITVVCSSFLAAVFGLVVMQQQDARYNSFTRFFLYFPTAVVFISAPAIVLLKTLPFDVVKKYRELHGLFGFFLLLPPLAMMIQFLTYSALLRTGWVADEFKCWRISMYISCIAGILCEISFSFHAYYFGVVRLHKAAAAQSKSLPRSDSMSADPLSVNLPSPSPSQRITMQDGAAPEQDAFAAAAGPDSTGPAQPVRRLAPTARLSSSAARVGAGAGAGARKTGVTGFSAAAAVSVSQAEHPEDTSSPVEGECPVEDESPFGGRPRLEGASQCEDDDMVQCQLVYDPVTHTRWLCKMDEHGNPQFFRYKVV